MRPFLALALVLSLTSMTFACDGKPCTGQCPTPAVQAEPGPMVTADDAFQTYIGFAEEAVGKATAAIDACNQAAFEVMVTAEENKRTDLNPSLEALFPQFQQAVGTFQLADMRIKFAIAVMQRDNSAANTFKACVAVCESLEDFAAAEAQAHAVLQELGKLLAEAKKPRTKET